MRLFDYLDEALLKAEQSKPKVSREAYIWPSSASVELYDRTEDDIVGKCHRAEIWRMMGEPQTNPTDEVGARKFRLGRACEADIAQLAKDAGIFVASGVRARIPDVNMTLELDLVVMDPHTKQAVIVENKSVSGWGAKDVINNGNPKKDAVIQLMIYLNEFRTGAILKDAIKAGLDKQEKSRGRVAYLQSQLEAEQLSDKPYAFAIRMLEQDLAEARFELNRNRIEIDAERLDQIDEGPLAGKLAYETRDDCEAREFDIAIHEDPVSKKHIPKVDGEPCPWFDLEGVYSRWRLLKERFKKTQDEAVRQLKERGVEPPPTDAPKEEIDRYWNSVGEIMRRLPKEFLPPAEYQYTYSKEKVESMNRAGMVAKTKYDKWKKGHKGFERIGSWRCNFCSYRAKCLPMEYPEFANLALEGLEGNEEVA